MALTDELQHILNDCFNNTCSGQDASEDSDEEKIDLFSDCGADLGGQDRGTFASPNWPRNYDHNQNCTWLVTVPKHKVIRFDFVHFDLGPRNSSNPCDPSNDRLIIHDMTSQSPTTFCATSPMTSYISRGSEVTLQLLTNKAVDAAGFLVTYTADWPCQSVLMTEDSGQLASPSWPLQYPPQLRCRWTIRAPSEARVSLRFNALDLQAPATDSFAQSNGNGSGGGGCNVSGLYDLIEIFEGEFLPSPSGGSNNKPLGRLCGRRRVVVGSDSGGGGGESGGREPPSSSSFSSLTFTSQGHMLTVTFRSDAHVQRTGFHASYKFLYPFASAAVATTTTAPITNDPRTGGTQGREGLMTALTAQFVEPPRDVRSRWRFSTPSSPYSTTQSYPFLPAGDDTDDEDDSDESYLGPIRRPSSTVSETFVRTMWTLVVCLFLLLLMVLSILLFVCRHYRKRSPKRRALPNYTFTEEELSLYEKDTLASVSTQNVSCTGCKFHGEGDPEITFSNPLYESRFPPPCHLASRTTSITTMTSLSRC